jgi:hypothetical protein
MEVVKSNTDLQKQTLEMQQQMLDVCKNSNTTINNNNCNNKTFNMQVFLNEKCKDAMNLMDFVNSMIYNSRIWKNLANSVMWKASLGKW